jgi:hypothetical protein
MIDIEYHHFATPDESMDSGIDINYWLLAAKKRCEPLAAS